MNTQPYKTIVIRDQEKKEGLSPCMESGNDLTVRTSGATVVVLADQGFVCVLTIMDRAGEQCC